MFIISMALFIIRALCLPLSTSNENVHKLCDTHRLCVELHDKNFKFDEQVYNRYQYDDDDDMNLIDNNQDNYDDFNQFYAQLNGLPQKRYRSQ